ncbi:MAG: hypothetical protein J6X55_09655 [Victivallales bacterium]|nr:hypothetical protein [Victivallales bacterium]
MKNPTSEWSGTDAHSKSADTSENRTSCGDGTARHTPMPSLRFSWL